MNAIADSIAMPGSWARRISDRHVFAFTAALFVLLTLAGFVPSSIAKIQAVQGGQRPPFPWQLHVHAVVMGAWLVVLLVQSLLAVRGSRGLHRTLGMLGALLLPAILASGVVLVVVVWQGLWGAGSASMPAPALADTRIFVTNILLLQIRALLGFAICVGWALWVRRKDPDAHQRFMLLGTAIPLLAGIERLSSSLGWTTMPSSPIVLEFYLVASVLPILAWDLLQGRGLHPATRIWIAINVPMAIATNALWNSEGWLALAPRLAGFA